MHERKLTLSAVLSLPDGLKDILALELREKNL